MRVKKLGNRPGNSLANKFDVVRVKSSNAGSSGVSESILCDSLILFVEREFDNSHAHADLALCLDSNHSCQLACADGWRYAGFSPF